MIAAHLSHDTLLADIRAARRATDRLHLWWLGQSGFLLQWQGRHLLLDPYLSDSLTRKYAETDKPHVRMTELAVEPSRLDFIDLVTSSHHHTDHLDAETLQPLLRANPSLTVLVPAAHQTYAAQRLQVPRERLTPIDAGQSFQCASMPWVVHAVPAAHEAVERDGQGQCLYLGYVVQCGPWTVYHSGDTVVYDEQVDLLRPRQVDVALLPINGRTPQRRVAGNLWGREAAGLARDMRAGVVIPCHYEMFEFNTATPDEFEQACRRLGQPCAVLRCGQRWTSGAK